MVRTSVTHWAAPRVPLLTSNHILTPSVARNIEPTHGIVESIC